jgi:hypothetical protein
LPWSKLRGIVPVGVLLAAWAGMPPERLLGFGLLWTMCVVFVRAGQIASALGDPSLLWLPFQLPVAPKMWLQEQRRAVFRSGAWLGLDWLAVAVGYGLGTGQVSWWLIAPLLAGAQGLAGLALAAGAVQLVPRAAFAAGATFCWLGLIVCSQLYESSTWHARLVAPLFGALNWLSPAGWLRTSAEAAVSGDWRGWLAMGLIGAGAAWFARRSARALEARFSWERVFGYGDEGKELEFEDRELMTRGVDEPAVSERASVAPPPLSPAGRADLRTRLRAELGRPEGAGLFARGWLGRVVVRGLSVRQRVIVDFLRLSPPWGWGHGWWITLALTALLRLWQLAGGSHELAAITIIGAWVVLLLPVFGGVWRGFDGMTLFHARIGMQSLAPVGFGETAATMLRVSAIRIVVALPLVWLGVGYLFTAEPLGFWAALNRTLQISLLVAALQPFWVIVAFSKTTNDTSARWWFTLLIALMAGFFLIGSVTVFIAVAAAGANATAWFGVAGWLAFSHLALLVYGFAYRRGIFDLVNTTSERSA